jgi:hypothetical protein
LQTQEEISMQSEMNEPLEDQEMGEALPCRSAKSVSNLTSSRRQQTGRSNYAIDAFRSVTTYPASSPVRQVDRVLGATVIAAGIYCYPSPLEASVAEGVLESN